MGRFPIEFPRKKWRSLTNNRQQSRLAHYTSKLLPWFTKYDRQNRFFPNGITFFITHHTRRKRKCLILSTVLNSMNRSKSALLTSRDDDTHSIIIMWLKYIGLLKWNFCRFHEIFQNHLTWIYKVFDDQ